MDTGTHNIKQIFGRDQRLIVPLFQRPYVWRRVEQWEPLWDDIRKVAERLLASQPVRPHFLGAIVLDQLRQPIGKVDGRLIIDGQQRLTTVQLFLEAFADVCHELKVDNYHRALVKLTRNDDPMSNDIKEIYKIWPTNIDQDHFRRVMDAAAPAELRQAYKIKGADDDIGIPIPDCYLYFHTEIKAWLNPDFPDLENRLDALLTTVRENLRLVVIDLDKDDDAQLIFETLNARGTPLLPSDLVKNFLFRLAELHGDDLEKLYDTYWKPIDDQSAYWRAEIGPGHAKRARIDLFLQNYLTMKFRDDIPVAQVYANYRRYVLANPQLTASQHLADFKKYADIFQSFTKFPPSSKPGIFFYRLDNLGVTTTYPFLLDLFARLGSDHPDTLKTLNYLESYLVRRTICQLTTRAYNTTFIDLLSVFTEDNTKIAEKVLEKLKGLDAESNRWPRDPEFQRAWMTRPVYYFLLRQRVRMVLEAIERQLFTEFTENVEIKVNLTIEHLMPQEWRKNWPLPDTLPQPEAEALRNSLLDTFGNLTLITKKLNPSISNGAWLEKKQPAILHYSALALNRELSAFPDWNEETIQSRGQHLFEQALKIWPAPPTE